MPLVSALDIAAKDAVKSLKSHGEFGWQFNTTDGYQLFCEGKATSASCWPDEITRQRDAFMAWVAINPGINPETLIE